MKLLLAIVFLIVAEGYALAQVIVDLNKGQLQWQWVQGTGGLASEFHVKCGSASGSYSKITVLVGSTVRTANIKDVITGSGIWYCVVTGANKYGESGNSNEVPFDGGVGVSSSPTNLTIPPQP